MPCNRFLEHGELACISCEWNFLLPKNWQMIVLVKHREGELSSFEFVWSLPAMGPAVFRLWKGVAFY